MSKVFIEDSYKIFTMSVYEAFYQALRATLRDISMEVRLLYFDHIFTTIEVDDTIREYSFSKPMYLLKLVAEGCDIYINLDRPISDNEYTIVWNNTSKVINRYTNKIYVKAPTGLKGKLTIEGLTSAR